MSLVLWLNLYWTESERCETIENFKMLMDSKA